MVYFVVVGIIVVYKV